MPLLLLAASQTLASMFSYSPLSTALNPAPPPVALSCPQYSLTLYSFSRTGRGALVYSDFESTAGWGANGGTWSLATGYRGYGLQGADNNGGIGGESQYYYATRQSITSGWVTAKAKWSSGAGYFGLAMINNPRNSEYAVEINYPGSGATAYLEVWAFSRNTGWVSVASSNGFPFDPASWYVVVASFAYSASGVSITAYVYDVVGNLLASASGTSTSVVFQPVYFGVTVDDVVAVFDDFELSSTDPRYVSLAGVPQGYSVSIYDNLGNLVASATSTGATLQLPVVGDIVVGTGSGGTVAVYYPNGLPALTYYVPSADAVLGGDSYAVSATTVTCSAGTNATSISVSGKVSSTGSTVTDLLVASVTNNDAQPYYARLIVDPSSSIPSTLYANLTLNATTAPASISGGIITSASTGWLAVPPGAVAYVHFDGYFAAAGQSATLNLYLEVCTLQDGGACAYYPVQLVVSS